MKKHKPALWGILLALCLGIALSGCGKTGTPPADSNVSESPQTVEADQAPSADSNVGESTQTVENDKATPYESKYVGCGFAVPAGWRAEEDEKDHRRIDIFPPYGWDTGTYRFITITQMNVDVPSLTYEQVLSPDWKAMLTAGSGISRIVEEKEITVAGLRALSLKGECELTEEGDSIQYIYAIDGPAAVYKVTIPLPEESHPRYADYKKGADELFASLTFLDALEKAPIAKQGDFCDLAGTTPKFSEVMDALPASKSNDRFCIDDNDTLTRELWQYDGFNLSVAASDNTYFDTFDAFYILEADAPFTVGGASIGMTAEEAKASIAAYGGYGYAPATDVLDTKCHFYYSVTDASGNYYLIAVRLDDAKEKVVSLFGFYGDMAKVVRDGKY